MVKSYIPSTEEFQRWEVQYASWRKENRRIRLRQTRTLTPRKAPAI